VANLTITIEDELLKRARVRAAEQDTSVNAVLREELKRFAGPESGLTPGEAFVNFAKTHAGMSDGKKWTRDDIYKDRLDRI
jgi:plasmid stability protein